MIITINIIQTIKIYSFNKNHLNSILDPLSFYVSMSFHLMVSMVSMTSIGSSGVIVTTGIVNVCEESAMMVGVVLNGSNVTTGLFYRVLTSYVLSCN